MKRAALAILLGGSYMFADASIGPADADSSIEYCDVATRAVAEFWACHDDHIRWLAKLYAGRLAQRAPADLGQ